ncbi:MAG: hypothetical protein WA421_02940 [Nitrososphaeraceae archaeon]
MVFGNITLQLFNIVIKRFKSINYFLIIVDRANMKMTNMSIKNDAAVVVVARRWMVNKIKAKITTVIDAVPFSRYGRSTLEVNDNNDFNITVKGERCSCWCVLFIDEGVKIDAKIIHKGRGKFKILEDRYMGKYINKIVDASDVIRCTEIS